MVYSALGITISERDTGATRRHSQGSHWGRARRGAGRGPRGTVKLHPAAPRCAAPSPATPGHSRQVPGRHRLPRTIGSCRARRTHRLSRPVAPAYRPAAPRRAALALRPAVFRPVTTRCSAPCALQLHTAPCRVASRRAAGCIHY